jgi:hypothetical protein
MNKSHCYLFKIFISLSLVQRLVTLVVQFLSFFVCSVNAYTVLVCSVNAYTVLETHNAYTMLEHLMLIYYVHSINAYNMFVSSMLILYLSAQCLYYERVLGEGDPPLQDPRPLKHCCSILSYISQSILISFRGKRSKIVIKPELAPLQKKKKK